MNPKLLILLSALGINVRKDAEDAMLDEGKAKADELAGQVEQFAGKAGEVAAAQARILVLQKELDDAKAALKLSEPPPPAEAGAQVDAAMEADPVEPPAPAAVAAKDAAAVEAVKADSIRKAVNRQVVERSRLEGLAASLGLAAADVSKLGNRSLRKAVVQKANPNARADADDNYFRAAIDMLPASQARRADGAESDPYAGVSSAFRANLQGGGGSERADADPLAGADTAWKDNIGKQFAQRHGIAPRTAAQ